MTSLHTFTFQQKDEFVSNHLQDKIQELYAKHNFRMGDSILLAQVDTNKNLLSSYTITTSPYQPSFEFDNNDLVQNIKFEKDTMRDITDTIECIVGYKNNVNITNSHIIAPHNATMKDVTIRNSKLIFDDNARVENSQLHQVETSIYSTKKLKLVKDTFLPKAQLKDVSSIESTSIINVNSIDIQNSTLKDVDIVRTQEQTRYPASVVAFDSDFHGLEHDMFDEDHLQMGRMVLSQNNVHKLTDAYKLKELTDRHLLVEKEDTIKQYSDPIFIQEHIRIADDGSKSFMFDESTIGLMKHGLDISDESQHKKVFGHDLRPGDVFIFMNNQTGSELYLTVDHLDLNQSANLILNQLFDKTDSLYEINPNGNNTNPEHGFKMQNSVIIAPLSTTIRNSDIENSIVSITKSDEFPNRPTGIIDSTLKHVHHHIEESTEKKLHMIADSRLERLTIENISFFDDVNITHANSINSTKGPNVYCKNTVMLKDISMIDIPSTTIGTNSFSSIYSVFVSGSNTQGLNVKPATFTQLAKECSERNKSVAVFTSTDSENTILFERASDANMYVEQLTDYMDNLNQESVSSKNLTPTNPSPSKSIEPLLDM